MYCGPSVSRFDNALWLGFSDSFGSTSIGGLLPMPPNSAYCVQRSDSISSAAARNRRMAASPGLSLPRSCAEVVFASNPTPTVAAPPASRPLFIKERRSTERVVLLTDFFMIYLLLHGFQPGLLFKSLVQHRPGKQGKMSRKSQNIVTSAKCIDRYT